MPKLTKIFADGTCKDGLIGWGIQVEDGESKSDKIEDIELAKLYNIGAEIQAVIQAVAYAVKNNLKNIEVNTDLANIPKWVDGSYKANNPYTKGLVAFIAKVRAEHKMNITFHIIDGEHNPAHDIARSAIGIGTTEEFDLDSLGEFIPDLS